MTINYYLGRRRSRCQRSAPGRVVGGRVRPFADVLTARTFGAAPVRRPARGSLPSWAVISRLEAAHENEPRLR